MECRAELLADCDVFFVRQSKLVGTLRWPVASTTVRLCLLLSSSWSLNTLSSLSLTELCPESFVTLELFRNKGCLGFVWTLTLSKDLEDTLKFSLSLSWFRRSVCPFVPFGNVDLESLWSSRLCSMKSSWSESMWHFLQWKEVNASTHKSSFESSIIIACLQNIMQYARYKKGNLQY